MGTVAPIVTTQRRSLLGAVAPCALSARLSLLCVSPSLSAYSLRACTLVLIRIRAISCIVRSSASLLLTIPSCPLQPRPVRDALFGPLPRRPLGSRPNHSLAPRCCVDMRHRTSELFGVQPRAGQGGETLPVAVQRLQAMPRLQPLRRRRNVALVTADFGERACPLTATPVASLPPVAAH